MPPDQINLGGKPGAPTTEMSSLSAGITPPVSTADGNPISHPQLNMVQPSRPSVPSIGEPDEKVMRQNLIGKVATLLQRSISRSRENSVSSLASHGSPCVGSPPGLESSMALSPPLRPRSRLVKETNFVSLEYDPMTRRKVLNTYEIRGEIGRGEHGKVKLARDLTTGELVAIKIVNRKSKRDRLKLSNKRGSITAQNHPYSDYETKIRREIAIMKRCDHKYIVNLKEVLDDRRSHKIYLVLEYLEKGEIKWKRSSPIKTPKPFDASPDTVIPCCDTKAVEESSLDYNELLTEVYSPNLTFRQSRKVFRDVLLGLEYLHMQGIIHRDIKPANLLVGSDNTVKISDFGVSFASYLGNTDEGFFMSEAELAKTVGTPAFFAPELCGTTFSASSSAVKMNGIKAEEQAERSSPKVTYKIDIWALGVTLYCLLFGKVPFNAESEFALYDVIVNQDLIFPSSKDSFNSPQEVSEEEFELAKDLLRRLLDKNSETRPSIQAIKEHPFVLRDLEDDFDSLHEFFFINSFDQSTSFDSQGKATEIGKQELEDAVVGVGARIRGSILQAIRSKDPEALRKAALKMEYTTSSSDESNLSTNPNSSSFGFNAMANHSLILSESLQTPSSSGSRACLQINDTGTSSRSTGVNTPIPDLANFSQDNTGGRPSLVVSRNSLLLQDELEQRSNCSSRQGSITGVVEAPQIETKRNVGGDLYLKNQSAIDAFKDIQQLDQKRRKSSAFASQAPSSPASPRPSKAEPISVLEARSRLSISTPQTGSDSGSSSKIKIGPISIDNKRRASSVISLPLTESFASLDSINDDYLTRKYQEFRRKKEAGALLDGKVVNSEPSLVKSSSPFIAINEKFQNFNLGSSMSARKNVETNPNESIAPTSRSRMSSCTTDSRSTGSYSSSCSNSESGSASGSDSDDEAGNLTLKFTSKVAPRSRPPFLSLSKRAHSHESNLPDLANHSSANVYDVPVVFQNDLLEFEDLPENLMGNVSKVADTEMTPSVSVLSQSSASTIVEEPKPSIPLLRIPHKPSIQHSPLRNQVVLDNSLESPNQDEFGTGPERPPMKASQSSLRTGYFRNHYKKEPLYSPFPKSKHLDSDKESFSKWQMREETEHSRPVYQRSNSITLGLLQHSRADPTGEESI